MALDIECTLRNVLTVNILRQKLTVDNMIFESVSISLKNPNSN